MSNADNGLVIAARMTQIESLLADIRALDSPGNYASGGVLFGTSTGKASVDATNFVWDNTNDRLGLGTNAPAVRLHLHGTVNSISGPHIEHTTTADAYTLLQVLPYAHDNVNMAFDARFDGAAWESSDAGSNFLLRKSGDLLSIAYSAGVTAGNTISTWTEGLAVTADGYVRLGGVTVRLKASLLSIANNGVAALGMSNSGFAFFHAGGAAALFVINGATHTTNEVFDVSGVYSITAGTAASTNVYWSAGNNRYEVENKRGATVTHRIWLLDAP